MNEKTTRVFKGWLELTDDERRLLSDAIRQYSAFDAGGAVLPLDRHGQRTRHGETQYGPVFLPLGIGEEPGIRVPTRDVLVRG